MHDDMFPKSPTIIMEPLDLQSLSLFRVFLGLYLLFDHYTRLRNGRYDLAWYTSDPLDESFPPLGKDDPHQAPLHKLWFYKGTATFQIILFSLSILLSVIFVIGYRPYQRLVKTCLFVVMVSIQSRHMFGHDGSDRFVRHLLFWSCFLPLHEHWTIHHLLIRLRRRTGNNDRQRFTDFAQPPSSQISSLASIALQLQIVLMYWGTVASRTIDYYFSSSWDAFVNSDWISGTAVHYALSGSFAVRLHPLTKYILEQPQVSCALSWLALFAETLLPLLCLLKGRTRVVGAFGLVFFHAGLWTCFRLPNWQLVGMLTQVIWLPVSTWWGSRINTANDYYKKTDIQLDKSEKQQSINRSPNRISFCIQAFFLSYMLLDWCGNRGWISKFDNGDIGEGLRLAQYWVMYRNVDRQAYFPWIDGSYDNQTKSVDLLHYIQTGHIQPPSNNQIQRSYPSVRLERALSRWTTKKQHQKYAIHFCRSLCVLLHHDNNFRVPIESIHWKLFQIDIDPPGRTSSGKIPALKDVSDFGPSQFDITVSCTGI